jgi:ligand-binding sensor domain-containing protein
MAKVPHDRFQTTDEMARALGDALAALGNQTAELEQKIEPLNRPPRSAAQLVSPPPTPAPVPATARRPLTALWLGAGAIVIAALALAALLVRPGREPSDTTAQAPPAAASVPSANLRFPAASSKINDLAVAADAIWAATDGGLVRWGADGSGRVFTTEDGLPFDEPGAIVAAADGTLWVGGGGVAHIRPTAGGISVVAFYTKDDGLGSGVIRTLLLDADGSLWAGGPQGENRFALSHFNGDSWQTDELPTDDPALTGVDLQIQSILRSRDGSLWLGLRQGGLLRWDGTRWASFGPAEGVGRSTGGGDTRIRRLVQSEDETLWAAASELGLLRFDAAQGRWERVKVVRDELPIRAVAQFAGGSLWAAGDGLIAHSADGGQTWAEVSAADSRIGNDIGSLVQDAAGRVWAGAYDGGVSVFDGTQWRSLQR